MKSLVNPYFMDRLSYLGDALHKGEQTQVFESGLIGLVDERESEVIYYGEQGAPRGSEAGARQGQRTRARRRPSRQAQPFRSGAVEAAHGVGFRILAQHYEALGFEEKNGLWVAIKTKPLGPGGPQAHLLLAAPIDKAITPRAWAFKEIGRNAELFPLKHTNFPDASICAFTKASKAWVPEDGLLPLVDHYSLWVAKSWHRTQFGWWPGAQVGACALYRRMEFVAREWCGCESGRRYSDCHRTLDMAVPEDEARQEFRRRFLVDYNDRQAPDGILLAACNRWKNLPDMAMVFAHRLSADEPTIAWG